MASTSMAELPSTRRFSVFVFLGLLALVSSFSTRLPSSTSNQNIKHACQPRALISQSHRQRRRDAVTYQKRTCEVPVVLMMSSQATTVGDSQEVQQLFSKYCDEDSLLDKKTLESMPPFAEMLVSSIHWAEIKLTICANLLKKNCTNSRYLF